ncbi:hypothetical protein ABL78_5938 [Leptomonas seymouri]|uniref:tRNA pseudouridine(55) synthase n=1 Tax=Leptomonas seymouri TaxID=5684 RepID=A0A0N1HW55_LEPSE|nr:hypothetical protein ABL78_5938 [Leptomonas seymouri]|eukprot:KPI85003.1 hypothetical protein ABL78_5938 [Leptomonas seymouri]
MASVDVSEAASAAHSISSCGPKEVLCYPCALRMSMLFNYPAPRTLGQVQQALPHPVSEASSATARMLQCPVLDEEHHPSFTIVHETAESAQRYFAGVLFPAAAVEAQGRAPHAVTGGEGTGESGAVHGSTAYGMLAGDAAPKYAVSWLCTACMGLYQFIDLIHAPLAAAAVRASPYFDSAAITININVNRSFTFAWLAVATRYFDIKGTGLDRPPETSIVKAELCNFKDFYMSDLRARILPYLLHCHGDVVASATSPSAISRSTPLPGIAVYMDAVNKGLAMESRAAPRAETDGGERAAKRARAEGSSSSSSSATAVTAGDLTTSNASGTPPLLRALQAFRYSGASESLVGEVFCRHHATEGLITEGHLPAAYCGNRSTDVLPYSVIYDYAVPYLVRIGWLLSPSSANDVSPDRLIDPPPADRRATARAAATVSCQLQHSNIFLMGNYCKMMRNMSQSPWFLNGQRIGAYSLQEVIGNPLLPFFFPDMPAVPPDAQQEGSSTGATAALVEGNKDTEARATAASRMERGAHSSRWQSVAPSVASSALVFGYSRYKFHSAGREDVDVRMLGDGRPFVLELVSPIRERFTDEDLRRLETSINNSYIGSVEVSCLRRTDAEVTVRLARHSESKVKRYRCVVWSSRAIENFATDTQVQAIHKAKDLTILQKTPLRVLHRRSLHPRPRLIHSMKLTPLNAHWFLLDLETQAGTYVKEFVHGDMGRTTPNLGMLLNARTDIIQLDVVGMAMQGLDGE